MATKLTVNIDLQGSKMYDEATCQKDRKLYEFNSMTVKDLKGHKDIINYFTRKAIPARQSINISEEAYKYMISSEVPEFSKKKEWNRYTKTKRLELHLGEIAKGLGGKVADYTIYPD